MDETTTISVHVFVMTHVYVFPATKDTQCIRIPDMYTYPPRPRIRIPRMYTYFSVITMVGNTVHNIVAIKRETCLACR